MHFEGEFRVPGKAEEVIHRFADVPRMARCVPGAIVEQQAEDGSWPGAMVVAFGPKKISFKGRVSCEFDFSAKTGFLHGRGAADMRAARIGVKVAFALRDDAGSAEPATLVKVTSDAELGGVLADFARTGGVAVANVIMQDFARRATEEFSRDTPPQPVPSIASPDLSATPSSTTATALAAETLKTQAPDTHTTQAPAPAPAPAALSAHGLLWEVIKHKLQQLARWLGFHS